jgi:hypothetical protein
MLNVISYLKGIPASNRNPEKPLSLTNFISGVNSVGDNGVVSDDLNLIKSDVAIIQGYVHEEGKQAPHLTFRRQILDFQKRNNSRTIIIDSNLFLYADPANSKSYLRLSYDGIFPNTGEYCYNSPNPARWEKIKKDLRIDLKPWRTQGTYILICLQRNGGWSMKGLDIVNFFKDTVNEIRKYTDRPIVVRTHPGDKKSAIYSKQLIGKNVRLSTNKSLIEDLRDAWATVVYNSSPSVASIIEGIPCFVLDPEYSQSTEVANLNLTDIENPIMPERLFWVQKLAQCHWNFEDLKSGEAWSHMRNWAKKS